MVMECIPSPWAIRNPSISVNASIDSTSSLNCLNEQHAAKKTPVESHKMAPMDPTTPAHESWWKEESTFIIQKLTQTIPSFYQLESLCVCRGQRCVCLLGLFARTLEIQFTPWYILQTKTNRAFVSCETTTQKKVSRQPKRHSGRGRQPPHGQGATTGSLPFLLPPP